VNFSIATSRTPVVVNAKVTATKGSVVLTGTLPVLPIGLDLSSPWAKFHGDAANTGYSPNGVTSPDWSATIGSPVLSSPAIGLDGTIYVGANNGYLYALKGTDGSVLWKYKTGARIASSPVVTKNGVVFVGSADKSVYAINGTNGAKLWSYKTGGAVTSTPCIGADGSLYVGSYDGYLYALAQTSGTKLWSFQTGGPVVSSPNISSIGILYVGSNDNCLYAIDTLSRTKLWSYTTGGDVQSSPALANGNVYFGSFDGNVYALSQTTGAKVWNFQTDWVVYSSPSVDSAGNVFVGSDDASIYSLNGATGALNWSYLTNDCVGSSPAIDLSGNLYVGSDDGNLYCLNAAGGSLLQAAPQNGAVESSPAITAGAAIAGVNSFQGVVVRRAMGWLQWSGNGHWYLWVSVPKGSKPYGITWSDAEKEAEKLGGTLATITSQGENEFVFNNITSEMWEIGGAGVRWLGPWLGGLRTNGAWTWVTGEPFGYANWGPGQPDGGDRENRLNFWYSGSVYGWNDYPDNGSPSGNGYGNIRGYVVEYDPHPGYTYNPANGHWYKAVSVPAGISWTNAEKAAEAEGGHLVTITNQAENDFVSGLCTSANLWVLWSGSYFGPWLGGSAPLNRARPSDGWKWVTGEQWNFTNWRTGEPSNGGQNENCLQYARAPSETAPYRWNDVNASGESKNAGGGVYSYIIEIDGYHPKTP